MLLSGSRRKSEPAIAKSNGCGALRQVELVVDDEVAALGFDAGARQLDLRRPRRTAPCSSRSPSSGCCSMNGSSRARRRQAAAADVEHVLIAAQALAPQEVEDPRALLVPAPAGRRGGATPVRVVSASSAASSAAGLSVGPDRVVRRRGSQPPVFGQPGVDVAVEQQPAVLEHADAAADRLDRRRRVRHEQDRLAARLERLRSCACTASGSPRRRPRRSRRAAGCRDRAWRRSRTRAACACRTSSS